MSATMLIRRRRRVWETLVLAVLCIVIEGLELVLRQAIWELVEVVLSNDCVSLSITSSNCTLEHIECTQGRGGGVGLQRQITTKGKRSNKTNI